MRKGGAPSDSGRRGRRRGRMSAGSFCVCWAQKKRAAIDVEWRRLLEKRRPGCVVRRSPPRRGRLCDLECYVQRLRRRRRHVGACGAWTKASSSAQKCLRPWRARWARRCYTRACGATPTDVRAGRRRPSCLPYIALVFFEQIKKSLELTLLKALRPRRSTPTAAGDKSVFYTATVS